MELDVLLFSVFHWLISSCGLLFNVILFYTALFHSPKFLRTYSILIINYAITDFLVCLTDIVLQPRQIPTGYSIGVICNGLCRFLKSEWACYFAYSAFLHLFTHIQWSHLLSFSYRCYVLRHPAPSSRHLILLICTMYLPSFVQLISFMWANDDPNQVREIIHEKFPHYNLTGQIVVGHTDIRHFAALYTIMHITLPITPIYITILYLRKKILHYLEESRPHMTSHTLSMHNQLLKALSYQALLPSFFLFSVIAYACSQFNIYNSPFCEYFIFTSVLLIPVLSPLVSLYTIRPYRHKLYQWIFRRSKQVHDGSIKSSYILPSVNETLHL